MLVEIRLTRKPTEDLKREGGAPLNDTSMAAMGEATSPAKATEAAATTAEAANTTASAAADHRPQINEDDQINSAKLSHLQTPSRDDD